MKRADGWKRRLLAFLSSGFIMSSTMSVLATPLELTLEDGIGLALYNNLSIKVAGFEQAKAIWGIQEAKANNGLVLSFSHADTRMKTSSTTTYSMTSDGQGGYTVTSNGRASSPNTYTSNFDNKFSLSLPLYTGGRVEGLIGQANLNKDVADLGVAKTKQQVKLDATSGYFNVLQAIQMLKLNKESVDRLGAHITNVQVRYEVGTVGKSDVLRSEVELANAQQGLIKAQNAYDQAVASFNNVLGMPLDTEIKVKENLQYEVYTPTLKDCIQYALKNRSDILQADKSVEIAIQGVKVAKSGKRPTVMLSANQDWNDENFAGTKYPNWTIGISANINLLDSGLTNAKVRQVEEDIGKAKVQAKQTRESIELEVQQVYLSLREAEKRIDTSKVAVNKAEDDYEIAEVRYEAGVGTNLDILDAQGSLTQAKTNYTQALYDYNASKAKLDKVMGVEVK